MSGETAIAWTEQTWNVGAIGCTQVSPGCDNCYAMTLHNKWVPLVHPEVDPATGRTVAVWNKNGKRAPINYLHPFTDVRLMNPASVDSKGRPGVLTPEAWQAKLNWPRTLKKPAVIFCNSMLDWLHSEMPEADIRAILDVCRSCPQHTFQFLTKRAGRLRYLGPTLEWPANVWVGVSIESDEFSPRAEALRVGAAGAAVRFISAEPLLGPLPSLNLSGVDWLIVGAESGRGARPMHLDWVRDLRDRTQASGAAFFFKQVVDETGHKTQHPVLDGVVWEQYPAEVAGGEANRA